MSHLTELAARAFASVGFNLSTVGGEEQARLVALYVQALQTLPAALHVQAQQSQAQLQAQLQAHARAQAHAQALRSHLRGVVGAGGSPILAAIGSPLPAIPSTPRTPLAPGSLQPTTSEAILTPSAGKENHGGLTEEHAKVHKFVEKDLLQLVELVTDAVSQHDEIEKNSPCWKRIGTSMKRGADVVYKKWACLKHAANEVSHPKTGQNMPFFKDKAVMKALNMFPLGAGFTQAVYEGVLVATGMSKDEAAKHGKIALGLSDYMPPGGGVKAVASAVKAVKTSEESGMPTSLLQAKRASKRKASQPNMGDLLNMYADRTEARRARRDIMEDYQRSMGAWRKECARVRSEDAAADRAALLEHMKSAREICQQHPLKVYDDEMDKMQKTWQKHKPKLELPEKPAEPHMPD
ncbi:hypothetical protein V8C86DRAFT_2822507, partial [Haematococcus lacustris]